MRLLLPATGLVCVALCAPLHASILSVLHLEPGSIRIFETYVAQFQKNVAASFEQSGRMWIDNGGSCCKPDGPFASGKPVVEARENADIEGGSIHHFSGAIHIPGGSIADVRHIMEDYSNYPRYFKPDVAKGSGTLNPDSTAADEHFTSHISIAESTLWMGVSFDCIYDTHYRTLDLHRWESVSSASSIREWRDPKDSGKGFYPEGDDHGFLWRTQTFWFARESNGGVDVELDSITLSRPIPTGFAWWGSKRTHDAVEKMLRDMKTAVGNLKSQSAKS
ncbi:MAG: hypothetical protein M3N93_08465 [Acidobacteriota bacterium]|nr:hypothetical protein [Acidobacteriota bacterium]